MTMDEGTQMPSATEATARSGITRSQTLLVALIFFATALNYVYRQVLALLKLTLQAEFQWTDA